MTTRNSVGRLVLIVGPSGAGKDSLMDYARSRIPTLAPVRFARRVITRPASMGEDHDPVGVETFRQLVQGGAFALHWQAHELSYGIPCVIDDWLTCGNAVVANVSRAILSAARQRYSNPLIVNITTSHDVLAERLERRGREDASSLRERLARSSAYIVGGDDVLHLDNSGALSDAGDRFINALMTVTQAVRGDCAAQCPEAGASRPSTWFD